MNAVHVDPAASGFVALAVLLGLRGVRVGVEDLRGAGDLLKGAARFGFRLRGLRCAFVDIDRRMGPPPWIAVWEERHLVVVQSKGPEGLSVFDPDVGPRFVDAATFAERYGGVALRVDPTEASAPRVSAEPPAADALADELRAGMRGPVSRDPRVLESLARSYGGSARGKPRVVARALCEADVVHALTVARRWCVPITTRGAGHAHGPQSLSQDGVLLVSHAVSEAPILWSDDDAVEVEARTAWRALERRLARRGRCVPVLTGNLDTSVGGTLSVGGYGPRSVDHGAQIDHVTRLRLILPDGEALWCSATERADLFRCSLAGLGQVGIIERAILRTVAATPALPLHRIVHRDVDDLADLLETIPDLDPAPCSFQSVHSVGSGMVSEVDRLPAGRSGWPVEAPSRRPGNEPDTHDEIRFAADYLVSPEALRPFLRAFDLALRALPGRACGFVVLPVRRARMRPAPPLAACSLPGDGFVYLVGAFPRCPPEPRAVAGVRAVLRDLLERAVDLGGRPYLYGSHEISEPLARRMYGPAWDRLRALRSGMDPLGLVNPDAIVREAHRHAPPDDEIRTLKAP